MIVLEVIDCVVVLEMTQCLWLCADANGDGHVQAGGGGGGDAGSSDHGHGVLLPQRHGTGASARTRRPQEPDH